MKLAVRIVIVLGLLTPCVAARDSNEAPGRCMKRRDVESVALVWKPTEEVALPKVMSLPMGENGAPPAPKRIEVRPFTDARSDAKRIGENREDVESTGCVYVVTTKDDVTAWVTDRFRQLLGRLGFTVVEKDGDAVLGGELRQFFVTEGGTYDGDVRLKLDVVSRDGKPIWSGLVRGSNGHWGKSFKLDNYYETLSDATIDAVENLVGDAGFVAATGFRPAEPAHP